MTPAGKLRELLLWCVPGLILGLIFRVLLLNAMPFAYVQHDSFRLLAGGADWLLPTDRIAFGDNVPWLVPTLYRLAQSGPLPALKAICIGQHILGWIQIALAGVLVRFWLARWKWWIIPVTLVFAAHPSFLWYEHAVMLEAVYVFAIMVLAVAGTWLLRRPSLAAAAGLCAAMALISFTRPEGKLFVAFGALALVVAFWKNWRRLAASTVMFVIAMIAVAWGTVPGESGLLLYSSVLHLSPETPRSYPGAARYVADLRRKAIEDAQKGPAFVSRPQREALSRALTSYVVAHPESGHGAKPAARMNQVAKALAIEICLGKPLALPSLAMLKFRDSADDLASGRLSKSWVHERQIDRIRSGWRFIQPIDVQLYGRGFADADHLSKYIRETFHPERLGWFAELHEEWRDLYELRLPDTKFTESEVHGLPCFYLLSVSGMLLGLWWFAPARTFHVCWATVLGGIWFIVMLTANERARFRMGFEPFIFLYPFVTFDWLAAVAQRAVARWRGP